MATITQTPVILVTEKDWEPWIELIKTVSLEYDLWEHIDPSTPWAQVPRLVQPVRPTPATVKPLQAAAASSSSSSQALADTKFSDLDANEKEQLRRLDDEYQFDRKVYKQQTEALAKLRSKVQATVSKDNLTYTYNCDHVWHMLSNLKNRFAPTDWAREHKVVNDWIKVVRRPTRGVEVEKWLQDLETAYDKAVELAIPDVHGTRPHFAFTNAVLELSSTFAESWDIKLLRITDDDASTVPFKDMVREFRDLCRINKARTKPVHGRHGAFPTSLQGVDANGTPKVYKCICGEEHRYAQCRYLVPSTRMAG